MNATSPGALYSLLAAALDEGKTELAVRMGYWGEDGQTRLEDAMRQLREERELTETVPWEVNYYPGQEKPGLIEFLLDPPEPEEGELPAEDGETAPEEGGEGPNGEEGGEAPENAGGPEEPPEENGEPPQGKEEEASEEEAPGDPAKESGGKN